MSPYLKRFALVASMIGVAAGLLAILAASIDLGFAESIAGPMSVVLAGISLTLAAWGVVSDRSRNPTERRSILARGSGSIASGGDVRGNAFGSGSSASGSSAIRTKSEHPGVESVTASGDSSLAAGGNIEGNAFGDESRA